MLMEHLLILREHLLMLMEHLLMLMEHLLMLMEHLLMLMGHLLVLLVVSGAHALVQSGAQQLMGLVVRSCRWPWRPPKFQALGPRLLLRPPFALS